MRINQKLTEMAMYEHHDGRAHSEDRVGLLRGSSFHAFCQHFAEPELYYFISGERKISHTEPKRAKVYS